MIDKIKSYFRHSNIRQFQDTRNLAMAGFAILAILVTWSGVKAIQKNYDLQKQISKIEQENQIKELENQNLDLSNKYYETDQYLELSARQQFGLAKPGETELIVPKEVALKYASATAASTQQTENKSRQAKPTIQKNFEAWMNFFLNRPQPVDE